MENNQYLYKVHLEQDKETLLWIAEVPALEPCISYGDTPQEAMNMIYEAMEVIIESKLANGDIIPDGLREYENSRKPFDVVMNYNQKKTLAIS